MVAHIGRVTVFVWFCCVIVGTLRDDSLYLFETIKKASSGPENAVNFDYHLGHLPVCRDAFFQFLGLPTLSTRALSYETMIRQGVQALPERKVPDHIVYGGGMQDIARQYIHAHIVVHAEKSPSHPIFLLDKQPIKAVYQEYTDYLHNKFVVSPKTFRKLWYEQIKVPVADPETGDMYSIMLRKRRALGFKKCDICAALEFAVMMAKTKTLRQEAREKLHAHLSKVRANRNGLQKARLECNGITICGFSIDGADQGKFPTPTTKTAAKVLGKMKRIKNKITGVEFFSGHRKLLIFRTLPNITTGANLTMTIICRFVLVWFLFGVRSSHDVLPV